MVITITVRCWHKRFQGDNSSHIEVHQIPEHALKWWKENSGNGCFDLLEYR